MQRNLGTRRFAIEGEKVKMNISINQKAAEDPGGLR